jgi:hypothetical protein
MRFKDRKPVSHDGAGEVPQVGRKPLGQPAKNTHPRGNGELDRRDVERGAEKLAALLGR